MPKLLEIQNINFSPGCGREQVHVCGAVAEGGFLVVRGRSGAGKTTLLCILARLRETDGGKVLLDGQSWLHYSAPEWRRRIYYLAQKPVMFDGTVEQNLKLPFGLAAVQQDLTYDNRKALLYLERLHLPRSIMDHDTRNLSGGEAARMALIRALLVEPRILLLDEPVAALDAVSAGAVTDLICEWTAAVPGRGVVLVSHAGDCTALPNLSVTELGIEEGEHNE